ncbi:MAG: DUF5103 domain-containing protein [Bacteroidetes bacterium]|nr:DUF5103 domain-containing protein [Bacteroidota bacterium]
MMLLMLCCVFCLQILSQQNADAVYVSNIKTVKLFQQNNQESLPVLQLNSNDIIELHFDDLDGYVKNYYYTFVLCNADWQPADVSPFDYLKGYQIQRITQYRNSSIAQTNYIHYQAQLPESSCIPIKSGNYLLKVFLNGNMDQLMFAKKFYVVERRAGVAATMSQIIDVEKFSTHQKLKLKVALPEKDLFNVQQQVKLIVMQNNRTDNAYINIQPTYIRGNILEYDNTNELIFEGGNEYRWADLRSFRFLSERIDKVIQPNDVYLKPDVNRLQQRYLYMKDLNGYYDVSTTESINPWWQTEYGKVHFTYVPPNNKAYANNDVYLLGELTGNEISDTSKMIFNEDKGVYEKELYLKQGYYSYTYGTKNNIDKQANATFALTEGNYWETENDYQIFVYFRPLNARHDELIALSVFNSKNVGL